MKYFTNCKTVEEAKKLYRRLAMENHPDRGGDLDTMKAINAEYDEFFNTFTARKSFPPVPLSPCPPDDGRLDTGRNPFSGSRESAERSNHNGKKISNLRWKAFLHSCRT